MRTNLPRAIRALRQEHGWRQADLAEQSGASRHMVSRIERGRLDGVSIGAVTKIASTLGATLDLNLRWRGEGIDRLLDAVHAAIQEEVASLLRSLGWLVQVEVSFNHYGDRGRVDVIAFHGGHGWLLVVEVKSAFGDLQDTLGRLDVKTRLGPLLAREAGWAPVRSVIPAVVVMESRTARRVVAAHPALFARFALRGRAARGWLRAPTAPPPSGLLWVAKRPNARGVRISGGSRVRSGQVQP